jgi:hypothetical protein
MEEQEPLGIEIEDGRHTFSPGDTLAGRVRWTVDSDPKSVELRLFWYTAGKGTQNVGVEMTIAFDNAQRNERRDFRMTLPAAPFSCSGKLVSIVWALELIVEPSGLTERVDLTIAPGGTEVILANATL